MATAAKALDLKPAARSGAFRIGGDLTVHRLGYGAMQITGPGVWGEPVDRAEALAVLRRTVELGINLIDTADSYGPYVSEDLIREALHPYPAGLVIATKAGLARTGPNKWTPLGRPEYLRQECEMSLRRLAVDPHRPVSVAPHRSRRAGCGSVRRPSRSAERGEGSPYRSVGSRRRRHSGSPTDRPDRDGAEPVQPGRPQCRSRARLLHPRKHRLHSLVPAGDRRARQAGRFLGPGCGTPSCSSGTSRSRLAPREVAGDAADSGYVQGQASGRERGSGSSRDGRFDRQAAWINLIGSPSIALK